MVRIGNVGQKKLFSSLDKDEAEENDNSKENEVDTLKENKKRYWTGDNLGNIINRTYFGCSNMKLHSYYFEAIST